MQSLKNLLPDDLELMSDEDYLTLQVRRYNAEPGTLTDFDCPVCKNKGFVALIKDSNFALRECECMNTRNSRKHIRESGLGHLLTAYTFESYTTDEPWQKAAKEMAQRFLTSGKWFFAGGQVGSGKTHLCTAMVAHFLRKGKRARYMLWRDDVTALKAVMMDGEEYGKRMEDLKTVPVLYIDDFFKTGDGKPPTPSDVNIAFEILNHRYNNPELITLISSERTVDEILSIDEAVGSRIYEKTKGYCMNIAKNPSRNYRTR